MKKFGIVSDTHGNRKGLESLTPLIAENDYIVHLGDGVGDMREIMSEYPEKVYLCAGNCDFFSPFSQEGEIGVESIKIFYCHGHKYGVKSGLQALAEESKRRGCEIALYGHTHRAKIEEIDGITLINPGALKAPVGKGGSYCYLVVNKDKCTPVLVGESVF